MNIRQILIEPNKILRQKSTEVEEVNESIQNLMNDMLTTMYSVPGIGLAAIQIGVPKRIIVIDLAIEGKKTPLFFVNPKIISKSESNATYEEGCLSVPGQFAEIQRPDKCEVRYLDYKGEEKLLNAEGLLATCIQHEIDHLEGILFIDYLSKLKKDTLLRKLKKQSQSIDRIIV